MIARGHMQITCAISTDTLVDRLDSEMEMCRQGELFRHQSAAAFICEA